MMPTEPIPRPPQPDFPPHMPPDVPQPPIEEPEPDILPDEVPNPNPDENDTPPKLNARRRGSKHKEKEQPWLRAGTSG
jgi:hypothetical protein